MATPQLPSPMASTADLAPPQSILRSASKTTDSLPSLSSSASSSRRSQSPARCITFAPLPPLDRRRRHPTLGVAGRTNMLRQRQANNAVYGSEEYLRTNPHFVRKGVLEQENDALEAIGQALGDVSRMLWRRLSQKRGKAVEESGKGAGAAEGEERSQRMRSRELRLDKVVQYALKEEGEEGAIWEEEGEDVTLGRTGYDVSGEEEMDEKAQIQTIVEVRPGSISKKAAKRTKDVKGSK